MTQQEFTEKAGKSTPGELWAFVQNFISQQLSAPEIAKQQAEAALAERLAAIEKAEQALTSGESDKIAEAIAAITASKQTDEQKKVAEIDKQIAELEAKKAGLIQKT